MKKRLNSLENSRPTNNSKHLLELLKKHQVHPMPR